MELFTKKNNPHNLFIIHIAEPNIIIVMKIIHLPLQTLHQFRQLSLTFPVVDELHCGKSAQDLSQYPCLAQKLQSCPVRSHVDGTGFKSSSQLLT